MSIHLSDEDIRSIDSLDVQQKILSAISKFVKETAATSSTFDLNIAAVPRGAFGTKLLRFSGAIDKDDLLLMREAIEKDCAKVDFDE